MKPTNFAVIPDAAEAAIRLRGQDAGANIGAADGPQGEPQDVASVSSQIFRNRIPGSARGGSE